MSGYDQYFNAVRSAKSKKRPDSMAQQNAAASASRKNIPQTPEEVLKSELQKRIKAKKERRKIKTPWAAISVLSTGFVLTAWCLLDPSVSEFLTEKVELGWLAPVEAASKGAKKSSSKGEDSANNAAASADSMPSSTGQKQNWTSEELSHFSKLSDRKKQLDLREQELNELEAELHKQKSEIEARIRNLEQIRDQIANVLKERVKVDQEKVDKLVEFYSNMKPEKAAKVLNTVDEDLAVEILGRMKKKDAAEVMNLLEPAKAQLLSEKFAGYQRR